MGNPKAPKHKELSVEQLRWKCNPDMLEFTSTGDLEPIEGILGQERALKALKLGVDLRSPGYNIYIAGLSGSGKASTVKKMLEKIGANGPALYDYAYVNNFKDTDRPIILSFPKGRARIFKRDLCNSIEVLKVNIPKALESEVYLDKKKNIISGYNQQEQTLMNDFDSKLRKVGLSLGQIKVGEIARPDIIPLIDDTPVPVFQLDEKIKEGKITEEQAKEIVGKYNEHQQELQLLFKNGLKISQEFQEKLAILEKDCAIDVVKAVLENLIEKYNDSKIQGYLKQVEESILENIQIFKGIKPEGEKTSEGFTIDYFKEYDVNIVMDNSNTKNVPIIIETSPTHSNLFGATERVSDGRGNYYSDFTNIKAGSLLRASEGYIVLNVMHLFEEAGVWKTLKRVLTYNKLEIQDPPNLFQFSSSTLKPEPIDINVKVILIGSQYIYSYLSEHEYDFKRCLK